MFKVFFIKDSPKIIFTFPTIYYDIDTNKMQLQSGYNLIYRLFCKKC